MSIPRTSRKDAPSDPPRKRQADEDQAQHREPPDGTEQADGDKSGICE